MIPGSIESRDSKRICLEFVAVPFLSSMRNYLSSEGISA